MAKKQEKLYGGYYTEAQLEEKAAALLNLREQMKAMKEKEEELSKVLKLALPDGANVCGQMVMTLKSMSRNTVDQKLARELAEEAFGLNVVNQIWNAATKSTEVRTLTVTRRA